MNTTLDDLNITLLEHPLHANTVTAYNNRDLDHWADLYHKDAVLLDSAGKQAAVGRDQIRLALERFLALNGKMKIETVYAVESGNITVLRGFIEMEYKDQNGTLQKMVTESIEVATLGADGTWRFKVDHPYGALPRTAETQS
ncbi:MAG: nuclear transport factor 2 family protein [Verrucomicrobia bacterium]|nr:nuclear transport factor 2 family protein [Verrucomicrobiota bacterium]MBV8485814.1 nuclear transport factor 2 family protein [Verrucomicrobiota bacterium]